MITTSTHRCVLYIPQEMLDTHLIDWKSKQVLKDEEVFSPPPLPRHQFLWGHVRRFSQSGTHRRGSPRQPGDGIGHQLNRQQMLLCTNLVRLCGQPDPRGLGVDDDKDGVGAVLPDQVVDQNVVLMELWPCVVPANNTFLGIHLPGIFFVKERIKMLDSQT